MISSSPLAFRSWQSILEKNNYFLACQLLLFLWNILNSCNIVRNSLFKNFQCLCIFTHIWHQTVFELSGVDGIYLVKVLVHRTHGCLKVKHWQRASRCFLSWPPVRCLDSSPASVRLFPLIWQSTCCVFVVYLKRMVLEMRLRV